MICCPYAPTCRLMRSMCPLLYPHEQKYIIYMHICTYWYPRTMSLTESFSPKWSLGTLCAVRRLYLPFNIKHKQVKQAHDDEISSVMWAASGDSAQKMVVYFEKMHVEVVVHSVCSTRDEFLWLWACQYSITLPIHTQFITLFYYTPITLLAHYTRWGITLPLHSDRGV